MTNSINPLKEDIAPGMAYVDVPSMKTRSQLNETRKELHKRQCEELAAKGNEHFPPRSVREAENEVVRHEFRRPPAPPGGPEPKTLTSMKDERRVAKIEHNLQNFGNPRVLPSEYPRYSDRADVPFWMSSEGENKSAPPPPAMPKNISEPVLKVTQRPWNDLDELNIERPADSLNASAAGLRGSSLWGTTELEAHQSGLGSHTVKKWTTDIIEHGQGRNKPRLFDNIRVPLIGPRDLENLDLTSSLEPVRTNALRALAEERKHTSSMAPRSRLAPGFETASIDSADMTHFVDRQASHARNGDGTFLPDQSAPQRQHRPPLNHSRSETTIHRVEHSVRAPGLLQNKTLLQRPRSEQMTGVRSGGFQAIDTEQKRQPAIERAIAGTNLVGGNSGTRGRGRTATQDSSESRTFGRASSAPAPLDLSR
jgi:hypothetical protein